MPCFQSFTLASGPALIQPPYVMGEEKQAKCLNKAV